MPIGTPLRLPASVVLFINLSGFTKLRMTRFTDGLPEPSPRSMIQWFLVSKSVMSRTVAQVQASLPQCHDPYTEMGVDATAEVESKVMRHIPNRTADQRFCIYDLQALRDSSRQS